MRLMPFCCVVQLPYDEDLLQLGRYIQQHVRFTDIMKERPVRNTKDY